MPRGRTGRKYRILIWNLILLDLNEANEELQAVLLTRGVEEGINLLNGTSNSLAQELHDMSQTQVRGIIGLMIGVFIVEYCYAVYSNGLKGCVTISVHLYVEI